MRAAVVELRECSVDTMDESRRTMTALAENLERLEETIGQACRAAGRGRGEVELMAVSKTYPAETIAEAAELGLRLFGENRVQEFSLKAGGLEGLRRDAAAQVRMHLIGNLQSNKAARAGGESLAASEYPDTMFPPQRRCGAHRAKRHAFALGFQRKSVARLQGQLIHRK